MNKLLITSLLAATALSTNAQSGTDYLKAYKITDCDIPFDVNAEGEAFKIKWGMDSAWDWDFNVNRGIAFYGTGNFETGRVSFQPIDLVTDNGDGTYKLSSRQQTELNWRIKLIKSTGTKEVNLNCDHEVLFRDVNSEGRCYDVKDANGKVIPNYTGYNNYVGKPEEWYKLIKATMQHVEKQGLKVISVSPFNESDYTAWMQYAGNEDNGMKDFLEIAKLIKADPDFDNVRVCGGNTLNCDRALPWYNYLKEYLDEGNTHQLAGTFDTYANFFAQVKKDGKIGTADELHNVGEAIVGAQYGMTNGIWWGFDSKARGQFMHDSNEGVRLGYGEDRSHWTAGAVYRNDQTNEVHAFIGSSERQANNSSYRFISKSRDVYFRGEGPTRQWVYDIPGGTGYQKGQINAEFITDITWGEDVAPLPEINGTYIVMNASSSKLLTMNGGSRVSSTTLSSKGVTDAQKWTIKPGYTAGDISFWFIDNAANENAHLNVLNNNLNSGAGVITYNAGHDKVEQWYFKYAKDGYYYIISALSNKYLHCSSTTSGTLLTLQNAPSETALPSAIKKYLWRLMPVDAAAETKAPAAPTDLAARQRPASIELSWTAPADEDLASYTVLRAENGEWNTIARNITGTTFKDNNVSKDCTYTYKIIAVDYSGNRSVPSTELEATPLDEKSLVMQLQFDGNADDATDNAINAVIYGSPSYQKLAANVKSGTNSLALNASTLVATKYYVQLPYTIANHDEMTIALWTKWSGGSNWQRIFDFGNGTDQYMFLCPSNGSEMRFVMKNGGNEQILSANKKLPATGWHHIAITISNEKVVMYYDGEELASSEDFTIKPSDIAPVMNYIGRSQFQNDPTFKGYLDDFRIYNYPLEAEDIQRIMTDTDNVSADYKDSYEDISTGIDGVIADDATSTSNKVYDLNGRIATGSAKGIVIKDNKKVLNK